MSERMSYIEARAILAGQKPTKYRSKWVTVEGRRFQSKAEGQAYAELRVLERAGKINGIVCQHALPLHATDAKGVKHKIGVYRCDFSYWDCERKERRWLEVKGVDLALGKWKRAHAEAEHGIKIEIRKPR